MAAAHPTFVMPFQLSPEEALERFRRRMTAGFFRPGDLDSAGEWAAPRRIYVPLCRATVSMESNWSAQAGTTGRN